MLFGQTTLGLLAAASVKTYPNVKLEVVTEDRMADLVSDAIDIVIRVNPRLDDSSVGRCFLRNRMVLVAPPELQRPPVGAMRRGIVVPNYHAHRHV